MTTIYQAISAVMGDVREVRKSDRNAVQGFNFRGIDAVMNAVGPALRAHGVIVVPTVESHDYTTVVVGQKRTEMGHAQLVVTFTWYGPEGDHITSRVAAEAMDSGDKAIAKAHSVALRTAMIQTLALPTDEPDPDAESFQRATRKPAAPAAPVKVTRAKPEPPPEREPDLPAPTGPTPMSKPQMGKMQALFGELGITESEGKRAYIRGLGIAIESARDLTSAQARVVIDALVSETENT